MIHRIINSINVNPVYRLNLLPRCCFSQNIESKYTDVEKEKILQVINSTDSDGLSRYDITKARLRKVEQWKNKNGHISNICDVETIDGFTERTTQKLFNSILKGPSENQELTNKIKGQILHPALSESVRQNCKTVLAVYVAVNSVSWLHIDRTNYEVIEWKYHRIDCPDGKKLQITDILESSWTIVKLLPIADVYVMKAEPTTLRAAGSDPNNPKVLAVNLQRSQMVAMMVALINAKSSVLTQGNHIEEKSYSEKSLQQKVYFLRPNLPFRLYGTLVGNEKVSTEQTVEMLLENIKDIKPDNSQVYVPENLKSIFRSQKDLQRDMLGHCLLLGITFMDVCIYKNQEKISKLLMRRKQD